MLNDIKFFIGEVVDIDNAYQINDDINNVKDYNVEKLFSVGVELLYTTSQTTKISCKPANLNIKTVPQPGELVLVFKGISSNSYFPVHEDQWYYLINLSTLNTVNNNYHPYFSLGKNKDENQIIKNIPQRQPYRGDILFEGRYGNSIRLGNTHKQTSNTEFITRKWSGIEDGNPIMILSTYKHLDNKDVKFSTEDINNDFSSLYLTSTQKLSEFKINNTIRTTKSHTDYNHSQLVGTADRVILKAKTDSVILDSQRSIELNTPLLYIGTESNKEPFLHSTAVDTILRKILMVLSGGFRDSSGVTCYPILKTLLSDNDMAEARKQLFNYNIWSDKHKG